MKLFYYHGRNRRAERVEGTLEAEDRQAALDRLYDQGFYVVALAEAVEEEVGTAPAGAAVRGGGPPTSHVEMRGEGVGTEPTVPKPLGPGIVAARAGAKIQPTFQNSRRGYLIGGIVGAVCLVVLPFLFHFESEDPIPGSYRYSVRSTMDFSSGDFVRKSYTIVTEPGLTKGALRYVADQVFAREKEKRPDLAAAMFRFFYETQDRDTERPAAILRFNWDGRGEWEKAYHFPAETGTHG